MAPVAIFVLFACLFHLPTTLCSVLPSSFLPPQLQLRTEDCHADNYTTCGAGFPAGFCCPTSYTCMPLSANTSVMCCKPGQTCQLVEPIPCNIQLQNVTAVQGAEVHTTRLNESMPTCKDGCCPFGYFCNTDLLVCQLEANEKPAVVVASVVPAASPFTSAVAISITISPSPSSTGQALQSKTTTTNSAQPQTSSADDQKTSNDSKSRARRTGIIVSSTIVSALTISAIVVGICFYIRRRDRKRQGTTPPSTPTIETKTHDDTVVETRPQLPKRPPKHDPALTKFRTWRGQTYYARADNRTPPEPVVACAELPATPVKSNFSQAETTVTPPPPIARAKTTRKRFEGTKPGKSLDRWSLR
ncbi:hypothetical protein BJ166DRAFT_180646 [Pestalotiopsis sp. NC0098]|nr:hypothetical protein BJ166DRAFT_180646 [Pestalotiopsis sp. NC0098]